MYPEGTDLRQKMLMDPTLRRTLPNARLDWRAGATLKERRVMSRDRGAVT